MTVVMKEPASKTQNNPVILVIDDDPEILLATTRLLSKRSYDVRGLNARDPLLQSARKKSLGRGYHFSRSI